MINTIALLYLITALSVFGGLLIIDTFSNMPIQRWDRQHWKQNLGLSIIVIPGFLIIYLYLLLMAFEIIYEVLHL